MRIFDFILQKLTKQPTQTEQNSVSVSLNYDKFATPTVKVQTSEETYEYDLETEYVCISTSGDENVCPMCAQFEGKFFPSNDAPKLPLCPSCACAYEYYDKGDLPSGSTISNKNDFILPAKCTPMIYEKQQMIYDEKDINKQIQLCKEQLKKIHEFMKPYISTKFPAPCELACRDFLPELYMKMGKWTDAENVIKLCIDAQAYFPEDGSEQLAEFEAYRKIAMEALTYIEQNPGCLQRNIYKALPYEGDEREQLKHFLRYSKQIKKIKHGNTNEIYCNEDSM